MSEPQKTTLFTQHQELGAKLVDFGGWNMPVSYSSTLKEHEAVRNSCGIFDVSHMGEIFIEGDNAQAFCQKMLMNNVEKLTVGGGQYSALLNEEGGFVDDLIIYRLKDAQYLLCVNASNTDKDFAWIEKHASGWENLSVENKSSDYSQIALQGPESPEILAELLNKEDRPILLDLPYTHISSFQFSGESVLIARTGYTGEKGYEIYCSHTAAVKLWNQLLSGEKEVTPCGLGARDTLRLEACYPLYGQEMDETVNPLEVGLSWAVKFDCGDFMGRDALVKAKEQGLTRKLIGFQLTDKGIARQGMDILAQEKAIGKVTSGSFLPTLQSAGGMALVNANEAQIDLDVDVDVRGRMKRAKLVKKPLYSARTK